MASNDKPESEQSSSQSINLSTSQQLAFVNKGTRLVLLGIIAQIGASLIGLLSFIPLFPMLAGIAGLVGKISILIGYVFSWFAPEKADARKYLMGALAVVILGGIFTEVAKLILQYMTPDSVRVFAILATIAFAMPLVSVIFYIYFLKAMADFTQQAGASEEAEKLAVYLMAITGAQFLIGIPLAMMVFTGVGIIAGIVGILFFLASTYWTFLFIQYLDSLEFRKQAES